MGAKLDRQIHRDVFRSTTMKVYRGRVSFPDVSFPDKPDIEYPKCFEKVLSLSYVCIPVVEKTQDVERSGQARVFASMISESCIRPIREIVQAAVPPTVACHSGRVAGCQHDRVLAHS